MFRDYYMKNFFLSDSVNSISKREFGFVSFEGWMLRHRVFKNENELASFIRDTVPRDSFFSCAYYEDPEAEMIEKGWIGADLIFDIDADHLITPCDKVHDNWICGNCGFTGKGIVPQKCPACDSEKLDVNTWPCEQCIDSAKRETIKLLEMLTSDFGFSKKEMHAYFSGHRGYHVHVESEAIKNIDSMARKEIVDYVCGLGLDITLFGLHASQNILKALKSLNLNETSWRGRIARSVYHFILNANIEDYKAIGLEKNVIEAIINNKNAVLKNWGNVRASGVVKGVGFENWKKIVEFCAKSQSANVDTVVTTDVHRLIRLAGTLHGKTGLKKVEVPPSAIEDFDPFKSAIAFKNGSVTVFARNAPEFRLGEETFGPYSNQKVTLPIAAAIMLICKGRAEVTDCIV